MIDLIMLKKRDLLVICKTEKTVISENGFTSRKNYISERFIVSSAVEELIKIRKSFGTTKYKRVDSISAGIELKQTPLTIESVSATLLNELISLMTFLMIRIKIVSHQ